MTNNKEERLIKLIRREQANKGGNYEEICELLFDEVNNLVRPVCSSAEESRKKVKKLFVRMLQQINEIDTHDDIHLWIAGFSTVTLYEILCKEYGQIITYKSGNIDYSYSHIDEDEEFKSKIGTYNDSLANPKRYMYSKDFFSRLTKGQIIIFEMFCYEGFTIDEIEELLEIDKIYITSEISSIRQMVLGNDNEEIELIAADNKGMARNVAEEEDSDDIAAIKAAVAAIVNDTVDEVNHEEGYKDIISVVNSFNDSTDSNEDKLGATLVNINKEHINKSLKENQYNVSDDAGRKDDMSDGLSDEQAGDKQSDVKQSDVKQTTNKKVSDIDADYIEDNIEDEDNDTSDEADTDKSSKKKHISKLFGIEDLSQYEDDDELEIIEKEPVKKNKKNRKPDNNKILKILSIAIPSVAVVIFVVILLTSGVFNKSSSTSNSVTAAETKTSTKKQESTTQESTTAKATEKSTQKTTAAKQTEQTTTAKQVEKTTEAKTEAQNNNTTRTSQQQNNQVDNDSDTQATESNTQATEAPTQATAAPTQATAAPTQATEGNTQATEGNTQATAAPTDAPTQATAAPTQADTVVDEKNGTALH